jgi:hypothetical protein
MSTLTLKRLSILAISFSILTVSCAGTRVSAGVAVGPPVCPYGYYEAPPYNCAPDGYYGPEWFSGGVFIGAGPWYHGADHFYGHVDHALDYRKGYRGPVPARGEAPAPTRAPFRGTAMHDPRGREGPRR